MGKRPRQKSLFKLFTINNKHMELSDMNFFMFFYFFTCVLKDLPTVGGDLPDVGGEGQVKGLLVAFCPSCHFRKVVHLKDSVLVPPKPVTSSVFNP
jgi:hypothetical protein